MILKRLTIYLSIILLASACYNLDKPKKPDNLISKEKMVDILIDAKIIASANSVNRKIMEDHGVKLNTYVYTKHNIDSLQFALSNEYYAFHIKDYEAIYIKVKDSLELLKVKFEEEEEKERIEEEKRITDSLKLLFTEKDSLSLIKIKDSLKVLTVKDSITEMLIEERLEEIRGLIEPISDKDHQ
ncbi:DUF4296 domain-containing protein [Flavivirga spongiicola]|uniref:DUF4296 domain-containing protein n=1 Tax=Flavivirga spongiicola TaxID=421621 RepID=A0ABU7XSJ8_9FLAO|nr:DUF4296 domain-containing protein [Flavivirga sp. MEBiC05379]MDO5978433.1 DUF4296 domain-containing protein [Flavivirga sp. MEBiC05379]